MNAGDDEAVSGKAKGGIARAAALTPERRKEISRAAATAKRELAAAPRATHSSEDHPLVLGNTEIQCYVLEDGRRVISQRAMQTGIGMSTSGGSGGAHRLAQFIGNLAEKGIDSNNLSARIREPILFRTPAGGGVAYGYEATVLADICDAILAARRAGVLLKQQEHFAQQAEVLVRAFARVGIIALVDEATGYQRDREKDALAKILEAFVAKELQPWVKTFPADYYEQMFRLRGLKYPPERASYRPQYFGTLTNDIVYKRLAPGLVAELKAQALKDDKKARLHQRLTTDVGHPKLREHLASVTTVMKLSSDYDDFVNKLDSIHPRYGDTLKLDV